MDDFYIHIIYNTYKTTSIIRFLKAFHIPETKLPQLQFISFNLTDDQRSSQELSPSIAVVV